MASFAHLLVVDDDREIRTLLGDFLGRHGYRVDAAADGRAMTRLLEVGAYDLVVLDLMLPGDDGLTLCRRLCETTQIPIIMLTALAEETERVRRAGNGCRRLPGQAVFAARAAGTHQGCLAPHREPTGATRRKIRCCASTAGEWTSANASFTRPTAC